MMDEIDLFNHNQINNKSYHKFNTFERECSDQKLISNKLSEIERREMN